MASRDLRKESFWRRMVKRQADGSLTVRAFCERHGQPPSAFYWWRAELARREMEQPAFVPVQVTEPVAAEGGAWIEIVLADQRRIRVGGRVDRQMLADVLAVMTSADSIEPGVPSC